MISIQPQEVTNKVPKGVSKLLSNFTKVFYEPIGLSPQRSHDH